MQYYGAADEMSRAGIRYYTAERAREKKMKQNKKIKIKRVDHVLLLLLLLQCVSVYVGDEKILCFNKMRTVQCRNVMQCIFI